MKIKDRVFVKFSSGRTVFSVIFYVFLLVVIMTWAFYTQENISTKASIENRELDRVFALQNHIHDALYVVGTDLNVAISHADYKDFFNLGDDSALDDIAREYLLMSQGKKLYDQIRYINEDGQEMIRVNYANDNPYIVEGELLRDKSERYYFKEGMKLNKGDIYVSPLDLNIEDGKVELPYKPMMRFVAPLFNDDGERKGVVVLNYLADRLIHGMEEFYQSRGGELMLLNQDGYFLKVNDEDLEWAFMFDGAEVKTLDLIEPDLWREINDSYTGQYSSELGLYTFARVEPIENIEHYEFNPDEEEDHVLAEEEYAWVVISFIPRQFIISSAFNLLKQLLILDLFLMFVVTILVVRVWRTNKRRKVAETRVFKLNELLKLINKMLRHDVLNKITGVKAYLETSELAGKNKLVAKAYEVSNEAVEIISSMRELEGSFQEGGELKEYDLRIVIKQAAKETGVKVRVSGDATVLADAAIDSVFNNLLRNAKRHAGVDSVTVVIESYRRFVNVKVADKGRGIDDDIRGDLFKEGVKSSKTGNTGLGLYVLKKTMERYGGKISFEDNEPTGTVFILDFPAA